MVKMDVKGATELTNFERPFIVDQVNLEQIELLFTGFRISFVVGGQVLESSVVIVRACDLAT